MSRENAGLAHPRRPGVTFQPALQAPGVFARYFVAVTLVPTTCFSIRASVALAVLGIALGASIYLPSFCASAMAAACSSLGFLPLSVNDRSKW